MVIINLTEYIIEYLVISSALLIIPGLLSLILIRSFKIQGKAKLWACTLIVILPLAYPLKTLLPESVTVPVPLELSYIQTYSEMAAEKVIPADKPVFVDGRNDTDKTKINETILAGNEISRTSLSTCFIEAVYSLFRNWKLIAIIVWGLFFTFSLIRLFSMASKINRFLRLAEPVIDQQVLKLLHQCVSDTGMIRSPQLFKVNGISTPMAMGLLKARIVIPDHLLEPEQREGLRFTLLHELKHLQQYHNWWLLIESIISAAYFFHPFIHWAKRKIHEELENICDRHVINVTEKSVSYADFLLHEIWQQNLARNPVLALPFISTGSKTTNRIHSILENTGRIPFMDVRNRIAMFSVMLVFLSIFICNIAPSMQQPGQELHMLNTFAQDGKENIYHQNERIESNKEISIIETPSTNSLKVPSFLIEDKTSDLKTASRIDPSDNIIPEEPIDAPVLETVAPVSAASKKEIYSTETFDNLFLASTQNTDETVSGNEVEKSISPERNVFVTNTTPDKSMTLDTMAEKYLGPPVNELTIHRIEDIRILDEYTVVFILRGGDLYLARLSDPCPGLLYANDFNLDSNTGKISKYDRIQVLSHGQVTGTTEMLGAFYPYRYEGNKTKAIRFLKKSLLTELIAEEAFKKPN